MPTDQGPFPPGTGTGGGTRRGSAAEGDPGARGRGPGSACTHRAALRSPGRRRVRPSVRPAVGASESWGSPAAARGGPEGGPGGGPSGRRAPGPPCPLRLRGGVSAAAGEGAERAPPLPAPPRPRGRTWLRRACAWSPECPGRAPSRRGVPALALQPSGGFGLATSASWASVSPPGRWAGLPEHVERARGAWPPPTRSPPVLGAPTPPLAYRPPVPAPSPHGCLWPLCDLSRGP